MSSDVAIKVENLGKNYHIYDKPNDRLKQMFVGGWKKYYREYWAVQNLSFEVKRGETVGIIGQNGCGKSTLLQMICGTLSASTGSIETHGRIAALLELGSGFNPEFSGRENIYMNGAILGLGKDEIDARYDDIVAFADIGDFLEQPVKTYSSGMVVRLAFAVIAHVNADILIIDEALSVGDAFFVQKCMRFMRSFMENGTVLFVSHDNGAVLNLCDRAILLENGVMVAQGAPKEVTEHYLEKIVDAKQGESAEPEQEIPHHKEKPRPVRDMRQDFINQTSLRNDIELFVFSPDSSSFGKGGAQIINTELLDDLGNALSWVIGGEPVSLVIDCVANESFCNPIIGFEVKDRLGQVVFGDNTFLSYCGEPQKANGGDRLTARFDFIMPLLPLGDYSIACAIAEGTQIEHVTHHWIHDAMIFRVHHSRVTLGLVGILMINIKMELKGKCQ